MHRHRQDGFSLIELMFVLAIAVVILVIATPSFTTFMSRYRLTTASNDFLSGITLTRNEAIKRGRRVDMIPATGTDWRTGWVVFVDQNNDQVAGAGEEIINRHVALPPTITLAATTNACSSASAAIPFNTGIKSYIAYLGTGYGSTATIPGGMILTDTTNTRFLCINFLGRPRVSPSP